MALCNQLNVEQRLQWDITAEPDAVVTSLIAAAQALIEFEAGRPLESDNHTQVFDGGHRILFLANWPVTAVGSVTEDGTALVAGDDFMFYPDGQLLRVSSSHAIRWFTRKLQSIEVSYTGGYLAGTHDSALAHLSSLCTEVVARAFRQGAASAAQPAGVGLGGITAVNLAGSDAVSFSTTSGASIELGGGLTRFVFLLPDEKEQIARYRGPLVA